MTYVQVLGTKGHGDRLCSVFQPPAWGQRIIVGGGAPRTPSQKSVMTGVDRSHVQPELRSVLRPIVGLTENLPKVDLEKITLAAIREHRRLRNIAEAKHGQCSAAHHAVGACESVGPAQIAYIQAMIAVHAQQTVLSTLLDVLGYIPDVPTGQRG